MAHKHLKSYHDAMYVVDVERAQEVISSSSKPSAVAGHLVKPAIVRFSRRVNDASIPWVERRVWVGGFHPSRWFSATRDNTKQARNKHRVVKRESHVLAGLQRANIWTPKMRSMIVEMHKGLLNHLLDKQRKSNFCCVEVVSCVRGTSKRIHRIRAWCLSCLLLQ